MGMTINIKYDIGDTVKWEKAIQNNEKIIKCNFCNGTGKVQGSDKSVLPCPRCYGKRTVPETEILKGEGIVQDFRVLYDTTMMKEFPNGPKILYYTTTADIYQDDIVSNL